MKKTLSTILSVACLLSVSPLTCAMQFGSTSLKNTEFIDLHHSGALTLNHVKVDGSLIVNGKLEAKETKIHELTVNGNAKLKKVLLTGPVNINGHVETKESQFDGPFTIHGHLEADSSRFNRPLQITSAQTDFEDCTVKEITIQKNQAKEPQEVKLKSTKVLGDIRFESGNGIVHIDDKSTIEGKVIGGVIKK